MTAGKNLRGNGDGKRIFGAVKVGDKGQIVIPKEARSQFNIHAGDTLLVLGDDRRGLVVATPDVIQDMALQILENKDEDR